MKRTYQPKKRKAKKMTGFLSRMKTKGGRDIIRRQRAARRARV